MDDMYFAEIQAQLANLASLRAERSQTPSPMWQEPHQAQHDAYWQPYEEYYQQPQQQAYWQPYEESYARPYEDFYAPPQPHIQYAQPNSGSLIDYNEKLHELLSLVQGSQNQAKEAQQGGYWQQEEEFYQSPYAPSQPPPQSSQTNSGTSMANDQIVQLLTSLTQEEENQTKRMQNQAKKMDELEKQVGQIMEFMAQIQEQSEVSNSTIENSKEDFEIHDAITLGSAMEVGADLKTSQHCREVVEELLIEEEEEDIHTAREEPPSPHPPQVLTPPTPSKVAPNLTISDHVPPNAPFPCRFVQSTKDEDKNDILDTFSMIQEEQVVEEHLEFKEEGIEVDHTATNFKMPNLAENVPCDFVDSDAPFEPILQPLGEQPPPISIPISINRLLPSFVQGPKQILLGESVDMDLRKDLYPLPYKDPMLESFEEHVRENVLEFLLPYVGKPHPPMSISFSTNFLLSSMIQAPTLEFKPLPDHFKYHLPFKEPFQAVGLIQA